MSPNLPPSSTNNAELDPTKTPPPTGPASSPNSTPALSVNWLRVLWFMLLATTVSNIARFNLFGVQTWLEQLPSGLNIFAMVFAEGVGIFLAAIIARRMLAAHRPFPMAFLGQFPHIAVAMAAIAIVLLALVGVENPYHLEPHVYGIIAGAGTLMYCIMEEYGWRGYLQTELCAFTAKLKYVLVGSCWYLWHLTFLTDASLQDNLFFLGMMIFGSWGIGQVAETTKSILVCACFHLTIQIMMFNALIRNGISLQEKLLILAIALTCYFALVKRWERQVAHEAIPAAKG